MPAPLKYSTDAERADARRAQRRAYYQRNKHKQLLMNMRWRHRTNPPKYITELELVKKELARLQHVYEQKRAILEGHVTRLESWNPLHPTKPAAPIPPKTKSPAIV